MKVAEGSESNFARGVTRRDLLLKVGAGTIVTALGGLYVVSDRLTREAKAQTRADGRPRLPPGQRVIEVLKPMGGQPGEPGRGEFSVRIRGDVESPYALDFQALSKIDPVERTCDVHCVTGWSVLGARWNGVRISTLAKRARLRSGVRFVIIEAAHGYTANVPLEDAMRDDAMLTWDLNESPLRRANGAPVRALVPDLYFWKSAKWVTGLRFSKTDEPGYWEVRGYHNRADPWKEERYA